VSNPEPLLIAKPWLICSMSRAYKCRLEVAGKTPAAIRLGRKKLWNRATIEFWIANDCPPRRELEAMLDQSRRLYRVVS
jgi:hypothetical protein